MLATTMPSYRFSISSAPRWGRRSPAISEAAVSTSRAASLGHTDRSQWPGSSRTTVALALLNTSPEHDTCAPFANSARTVAA